jgi:hypothetical protein
LEFLCSAGILSAIPLHIVKYASETPALLELSLSLGAAQDNMHQRAK